MKNLLNVEVIHVSTVDGKMEAIISYQDPDNIQDLNNGYAVATVPVNLRDLQRSARGNVLVNQSIRDGSVNAVETIQNEINEG
ncbi:hypothetical protein GCM10028807_32830 [Spirosoma daeguense]